MAVFLCTLHLFYDITISAWGAANSLLLFLKKHRLCKVYVLESGHFTVCEKPVLNLFAVEKFIDKKTAGFQHFFKFAVPKAGLHRFSALFCHGKHTLHPRHFRREQVAVPEIEHNSDSCQCKSTVRSQLTAAVRRHDKQHKRRIKMRRFPILLIRTNFL